jgi:uncharacterized protein with GYD domain
MATFIMVGTYSQDAIDEISSKRTNDAKDTIASNGGKMLSAYVSLGDADIYLICEFPDMKSAMKSSITLTKSTGISFSTNECVTAEEFDNLMG